VLVQKVLGPKQK